jgi:hypothetical protein
LSNFMTLLGIFFMLSWSRFMCTLLFPLAMLVLLNRDEIDRKQSKICIIISYHICLLKNDIETIHSKMIPITKKLIHWKWNHRIENMSISIDNGTSNRKHRNHEWTYMQHVHNQMSDQQSNMNITAPYTYTITTYDSQLLNFEANKFLSQQPTYQLGCWWWSCPRVGDCEWRLKLYT